MLIYDPDNHDSSLIAILDSPEPFLVVQCGVFHIAKILQDSGWTLLSHTIVEENLRELVLAKPGV